MTNVRTPAVNAARTASTETRRAASRSVVLLGFGTAQVSGSPSVASTMMCEPGVVSFVSVGRTAETPSPVGVSPAGFIEPKASAIGWYALSAGVSGGVRSGHEALRVLVYIARPK